MRIIAGQLKGQKLCAFSADFIRPMTDRVKTSLFDILSSHHYLTPETQVLDLFSGTGNLAFEALSRGAQEVCLVENSRKAMTIIKKNCEKLKPVGLSIHNKDVFRFLSTYKGQPFDLILADPPFRKQYGQKILSTLASSSVVSHRTKLCLELSKKETIPENSTSYNLIRQKNFGDKTLLFYQFTK